MSDVCVVVTICFRILLQLSHHIFKTKATVSGFFENAAFVFSHCFWNFLFLFHYTFLRRYQLKNFLMLPLVISFPISGKTAKCKRNIMSTDVVAIADVNLSFSPCIISNWWRWKKPLGWCYAKWTILFVVAYEDLYLC